MVINVDNLEPMKIILFYDLQLLKEKLTDCREKEKETSGYFTTV